MSHRARRIVAIDRARRKSLRTRAEIRLLLLHERGVSLTAIARDANKDLSFVSRVNRAERRSAAVEQMIAARLGLSLSDVFPEWYDRSH